MTCFSSSLAPFVCLSCSMILLWLTPGLTAASVECACSPSGCVTSQQFRAFARCENALNCCEGKCGRPCSEAKVEPDPPIQGPSAGEAGMGN